VVSKASISHRVAPVQVLEVPFETGALSFGELEAQQSSASIASPTVRVSRPA